MDRKVEISRHITRQVTGHPTSDGAGVQLTRVIGTQQLLQLDPFLLLDEICSDNNAAYIGGFPPSPHRGFETVTYLLAGRLRHEDSAGHSGVIESGGVQWMTAGRGVVHSEMPEQEDGLLHGFQLWVNLPAKQKMMPPRYQEYNHTEIPDEKRPGGVTVRVIAGQTTQGTAGPVQALVTSVIYLDITPPSGRTFEEALPTDFNAFIYPIEGELLLEGVGLKRGVLAVLSSGERVTVTAKQESRFLLIAGESVNEPIARHGPFVMNTEQELKAAFSDYQNGLF